jgi:glycogen operon protein
MAFTRQLLALRLRHPVFRRRRFLTGADARELGWYIPAGTLMTDADWKDDSALGLAVYLDGQDSPDRDADGRPLLDDDFLVLVNAWWELLDFTVPVTRGPDDDRSWQLEINTFEGTDPSLVRPLRAGDIYTVSPRSVVVLRAPRP